MKDDIIVRTREEWDSIKISQNFERNKALGIVLHNMENANRTPSGDPEVELETAFRVSRDCQHDQMHRPKPFSDIGQNFTISRGAVIMEGRKGSLDAAHHGQVSQGAHASGVNHFNKQFHGIELEGDFKDGFVATEVQKEALYNLCAHLRIWAGNPAEQDWHVIPHAEVLEGHTDCPRKLIDHMDEVRVAIRARINELIATKGRGVPAVDTPVLNSDLLQGDNTLEAVADGHLVLHTTGGKVEGIGPIQDALNRLGFPINLGNSNQFRGFFGEKTQAALMAFQQATPGILNPTGVVDQDTVKALDAALLKHGVKLRAPVPRGRIKLVTKGKVVATLKEKPGGSGPLRSVDIMQLPGRVGFYYKAAMAIDVDGSPRAYTQDANSPKPLDSLESVDSEGIQTMYVQQRSKTVHGVTHVGEGPLKDFFVSRTSLLFKNDEAFKTSNFVDAEQIPYIVFPHKQKESAVFSEVSLGDMAYVIDLKTGRTTHAIFADTNPKVGEASLRVALNLGRSDLNAHNGDEEDHFLYILFPGTRFDPEPTVPHWPDAKIKKEADKAFAAWGAINQVRTLFPTA